MNAEITYPVTLEKLFEIGSVSQAIQWAQNNYGEYPTKPTKPRLPANYNSKMVLDFADELRTYEVNLEVYKKDFERYQQHQFLVNQMIETFIRTEASIEDVPVEYREKVWSRAWDLGHASGYFEVYVQLSSLVTIFQ